MFPLETDQRGMHRIDCRPRRQELASQGGHPTIHFVRRASIQGRELLEDCIYFSGLLCRKRKQLPCTLLLPYDKQLSQ